MASPRGTWIEQFRLPGDNRGCLGCGYDLRATAADARCPECGCQPRNRFDGPLMKWLDHGHAQHILLALRVGTMGLFLFGFGTVLLAGLATFAIMSELAQRTAGYAVVVMGVVLVCWGGYLLLGIVSAAILLRVGRTPREPRFMREERNLVVYICLVAPVAWLVCAFVGSLLLQISEVFATLVIPMNALLIGGPALAVHHWATRLHEALATRHAERRKLSRRRMNVAGGFIAWLILAFAGSVVIVSIATQAPSPDTDDTLARRVIGAIVLLGGVSFGVLMLVIGRGVWAMRCRLLGTLPVPASVEPRPRR